MKLCTGVIDITVTVATPKKKFHLIVLSAGSHFGGIFEPILAKNIEMFSANRGI